MNLEQRARLLKRTFIASNTLIAVIYGAVLYHLHNADEVLPDGVHVVSKLDSPWSWTAVAENPDGAIDVGHFSVWGRVIIYYDTDNDGDVDSALLRRSIFHSSKEYVRGKDFVYAPGAFRAVDEEFREQLKRFRPLLRRARR